MTSRDPFELWMTERKKARVPADFTDRVMSAVRTEAALGRAMRPPDGRSTSKSTTSFAVLTLSALVAAGSGVAVLVWHAALVGTLVLAIAGTAQ
jgi:hypothetical protein